MKINKQEINDILKPILTKEILISETEALVHLDNLNYVEAILHICNRYELDPEDVAKLIKKGPLKNKIQIEAEALSLLPKELTGNTLF